MKNIKKIIIILLVLLVILAIILTCIIFTNQGDEISEDYEAPSASELLDEQIQLVDNYNNYYMIQNAIVSYYTYISEKNSEAVYEILDKVYIDENQITIDNILTQVDSLSVENFSSSIIDMYEKQGYANTSYCVHGTINYTIDRQENLEFYLIVYSDTGNLAYSIEPITANDFEEIVNNTKNIENKDVELNSYNKLIYANINDESIISNMLRDFKDKAMNNPEEAYNMLDEEYKQARFSDYSAFENYIENSEINYALISQYTKKYGEDVTRYMCTDQNGNTYIFYVTDVMKYTVILDTYTIDLPEFVEEYNNSSDAEKVILNIQRIFEAINSKDYSYVYNKLDATFKQNNFPTLEEFEQYMENTFYDNNSVGYTTYQTSGNLHIYELSITDKDNIENTPITKNFIMQLLDGTNFVMSFNV